MLIIRFSRRGRKKQAFFDLVVTEKSRAVKKNPVERLGYFNPHADGGKGELVFDAEKIEKYIKNGAQMSQASARILSKHGLKSAGKFIEVRASKPKKEKPAVESKQDSAEESRESGKSEGAENAESAEKTKKSDE